jgi:HlyD family secretion protein
MKKFIDKIKLYVVAHKIISVIALILIILIGYWGYSKATSTTGETRYVLSKVTKGTIVSSVTGSGQVSALNQIDIKPNVSGTITYVGVRPGDKVGSGKLLFAIDDTNARKTVRDAEMSLQSTQIAFDKLKIQNSNENMNADLAKAYDDGFNTVSNVFLDLPDIMTGLNDMFFKSNSTTGQWNIDWYEGQARSDDRDQAKIFKQNFVDSYNKAKTAYDASFDIYKTTSRTSSSSTIEALILQTYNTTKLISDAIKTANNYIDFINSSIEKNNADTPAIMTTHKASLNSYTSKTNTHLLNLLSITTSIKTYKDAFTNSDLDNQSQQLSVTQKQNALQDAKDNLSYYSIHAPFSGTIASVPIQKGDTVSSGTTLGTIITTQQMATISLNEVDIAKIQLGQKATLTFDAVTDLTITGKVAQIDSIGTVSQGVVNYNVKISFDTNDERIKPGMSVSAAIITKIKQDILTVPNSAIKNQNGSAYVEMFDTPLLDPLPGVQGSPSLVSPRQQNITTGISNDTSTEIVSGLNENDSIVTKTITGTSASKNSTPSLLNAVGGNNKAGAAARIPGR